MAMDLPRYYADESYVRLVLPTRTHAPLRSLCPRGASQRRSARPRRSHPAVRAHETRVTGPLDRGRAASAPGRRVGGPARLAPRARRLGCARQRSRHPLSAASPARGSRRCGGPRGGRCPGRRGVGAPAVDCACYQGIPTRAGSPTTTERQVCNSATLRSSVTSLTRASIHTSSVSRNLWLFVCRTNLHRSPTTSRGTRAVRNTRYWSSNSTAASVSNPSTSRMADN